MQIRTFTSTRYRIALQSIDVVKCLLLTEGMDDTEGEDDTEGDNEGKDVVGALDIEGEGVIGLKLP